MPLSSSPLTSQIESAAGVVASENCTKSKTTRDVLADNLNVPPKRVVLANCRPVLDSLRALVESTPGDFQLPAVRVDVVRHSFQRELAPQERELLEFVMVHRRRFASVGVSCPDHCRKDLDNVVAAGFTFEDVFCAVLP
ncbi:MAG: hypothetical protein UV80_C0007G0052 [Candidatus Peregrinibacteria bacterium GW2011_GWF2_43_17]|nr:MAG: hypothetical protein UV80_C0007G0052 [Candidatus Peregrinibacteria bacterium GW2011_GWF2_43_17]KKT19187.1 MAG: hypothetical protein UW03_C0022G0003 [Candidatus Peregrinibacteria bacterium GW2011_GWA2_43_8]HAU39594.1 hypothetical protein [Candidatus Peregrinibacteria bacterium]